MRRTTKNKLLHIKRLQYPGDVKAAYQLLSMSSKLDPIQEKNLVMKRYFSIATREAFLVLRLRALSEGLFFPIHKTNHRTNQTASIASLMRALVITTKSYLNK